MVQHNFRRIFFTTLGLICPFIMGCLAGYAYPTVGYISAVRVESPPDEIHAYRVDVTDKQNCFDCDEPDRYVFSPIRLNALGRVPSQTQVGLDYGWVFYQGVFSYFGHTHRTVLVRLYRPGWRTVEINSWEKTSPVVWKKAQNLTIQEQAVDDLISTWKTDFLCFEDPSDRENPLRDQNGFRGLAPGAASASHRQALLFAASEYDRLALLLVGDNSGQDQRKRLLDKSQWLRKIAETQIRANQGS